MSKNPRKTTVRRNALTIGRRTALTTAAIGLLLSALPALHPGRGEAGRAGDIVDALWSRKGSARKVGERYLAQAPEDADPDHLAAALFDGAPDDVSSPEQFRSHIDRCRARDFEVGDTVIVDGWVLARTEARLCAFAALV